MGDLRSRALNFARKNADTWTGDDIDNLTALLAETRAERLACDHLAGELQGEDGGMRWCAGCEREARIRAEVVEEAAREVDDAAEHYPADYVAVRREDLEWLLEEAETCEVRMPTSNPTLNARYAERFQRIRAALARKENP